MAMLYYLVGGLAGIGGMCGAGVDRRGVGVLDLVFGVAGGGPLIAMRCGVVELGGLCPDCGEGVLRVSGGCTTVGLGLYSH